MHIIPLKKINYNNHNSTKKLGIIVVSLLNIISILRPEILEFYPWYTAHICMIIYNVSYSALIIPIICFELVTNNKLLQSDKTILDEAWFITINKELILDLKHNAYN